MFSELIHAVCSTSARMVLKLGTATTVLAGGMVLLVNGQITLLTLFACLILVSRLASRFWDVQRGKITVGGMACQRG